MHAMRTLSRERAVTTAITILDARGAPALTMRGVAREMGVPLMSLYRHVRSKDDLEDAIVQALVSGIPEQGRSPSWDVHIRSWARAYRTMVRAHPNAAPLLASRPAAGYGARPGDAEGLLSQLTAAGLSPADAAVHLRAALVTITGFCNVQAASELVDQGGGAPDPPGDYPLLAVLMDDVRNRRHGDRVFDAMVASVVAGLRGAIAARE